MESKSAFEQSRLSVSKRGTDTGDREYRSNSATAAWHVVCDICATLFTNGGTRGI